jgi:hypothetical protein
MIRFIPEGETADTVAPNCGAVDNNRNRFYLIVLLFSHINSQQEESTLVWRLGTIRFIPEGEAADTVAPNCGAVDNNRNRFYLIALLFSHINSQQEKSTLTDLLRSSFALGCGDCNSVRHESIQKKLVLIMLSCELAGRKVPSS